jgi:hypothetical protein
LAKSKFKSGIIGPRCFSKPISHLIILASISTTFCLLISGCSSREIEVGEIKYKKVVGIDDGDEHTVLTHNLGEKAIVDTIYADYIPVDTLNVIINDELSERLLSDFEDVRYYVGLELCKNEDLEEFKLGRDHFNKLRLLPGLIVKVEYETRGNRVISLIDY